MEPLDMQIILRLLPQRFPFLMIDRILELEPGKSVTAVKNVSANEPYFPGHFPENPIMPGVMIIEALAQVCGILSYPSADVYQKTGGRKITYFAGVDNARFKRIVVPGDQLILKAKILKIKNGIWKCEAVATVEDQVACSAVLLGAIKEASHDD